MFSVCSTDHLLNIIPRLSEHERRRAIGMLQAGLAHNTIGSLWRRLQQSSDTRDRHRSERPHVTSRRQDTRIRMMHFRNCFQMRALLPKHLWIESNYW